MVMDDDEITLHIFYTKAFWELKDDTIKTSTSAFTLCILVF